MIRIISGKNDDCLAYQVLELTKNLSLNIVSGEKTDPWNSNFKHLPTVLKGEKTVSKIDKQR